MFMVPCGGLKHLRIIYLPTVFVNYGGILDGLGCLSIKLFQRHLVGWRGNGICRACRAHPEDDGRATGKVVGCAAHWTPVIQFALLYSYKRSTFHLDIK